MLEKNIILQQNYCYVLVTLIYKETIRKIGDFLFDKVHIVRMSNGNVEFEDKGAYLWYVAQLDRFSLKDTNKTCFIEYQFHIKFDEKNFINCYLFNNKNEEKIFEKTFELQQLNKGEIDNLCENLSGKIFRSIMDEIAKRY